MDLNGVKVTAAGLKELAALKTSRTSICGSTQITDKDLKEVASFKNLLTLDLEYTKVTDEGLKALAPLQKLTTLYLPLTDTRLRVLRDWLTARSQPSPRQRRSAPRSAAEVVTLNLTYPYPMTQKGLKEFTAFTNLTTLNLQGMLVTKEVFKTLASFKHLAARLVQNLWDEWRPERIRFPPKSYRARSERREVSEKGLKELVLLKNSLRGPNVSGDGTECR